MSRVSLIVLAAVIAVLLGLFAALTSCPDEQVESILAGIPDPAHKHREGDDLSGWRYASETSERSGETYYFYHMPAETPDAPVFVLIHGLFLDGRTFSNFDSLASKFELYALETPQTSSFYTGRVSDFAAMLDDFLGAIGVDRIYLAGNSLGGQIALTYLLGKGKTRVDGLALIATDMVKDQEALFDAKRNVKRILGLVDDDDCKMLCILSKVVEWKKRRADETEREVLSLFDYKRPEFYRQVMYAGIHLETPPALSKIKIPTLVVLGDSDGTISFNEAKTLVDYIDGARLEVIKGGNHDLAFTRADEVVAHILSAFAPR